MPYKHIAAFLASAALIRAAQATPAAIRACTTQTRRARRFLQRSGPIAPLAVAELDRRCRACGRCVMADRLPA